ncbi:MAG: amino acid ABC transporter ATP-binding protein [Candidatus Chromulinivorax sp.]
MLSLKNIFKKFHNRTVVDNVSLDVLPGQIIVLLGKSGVGKSTILRILSGLEKQDSGTITYNEQPLPAHSVGMVFQEFNLFPHLTVEENITLPLEKVAKKTSEQAKKIAEKLLEQYELLAQKDMLPARLSGGQKQRVALARTVAMEPKIICCDEPTSALDPLLTSKIAQEINHLAAQGFMIVLTTHDTEFLKQINCIVNLMQDGKIIETAVYKEFAQHPEKYPYIKNFTQGFISDTTDDNHYKS